MQHRAVNHVRRRVVNVTLGAALAVLAAVLMTGNALAQMRASTGVTAVTAVAVLVGVRRHRPGRPVSWIALASALFLFAGVGLVADVLVQLGRIPSQGAIKVAYTVGYALLFTWAASLVRSHGRMRSRGDCLDLALMVVAAVTPLYLLVLEPLTQHSMLVGADKAELLSHPILAVALMTLTLRLALTGNCALSLRLLVASTAFSTIGNIVLVAVRAQSSMVDTGRWSHAMWWIASALAVVAALHPSMRAVADRVEGNPSPHRLGIARTVGIGGALVTPTLTGVLVHEARHDVNPIVIVGPVLVMVALLLWRLRDLLQQSEEARRAVERQQRYFRAIALNLSDALVVTDHDGVIVDVTPTFESVFGAKDVGTRLDAVLPGSAVPHLLLDVRGRSEATALREAAWRDVDGHERWFEVTAANMLDNGSVAGIVWVLRDISEKHAFTEQLRHQALHDALTGLPNRVLLADRLGTALARARRAEDRVAVLFIDLDNFKAINDGLGHEAGDRLLVAVADSLRASLRESDTLARLGGDEFAVVAEVVDDDGARETAARLRAALAGPFTVDGVRIPVTASVGVASARIDDADLLLREADVAMYQAKAAGKNGIAFFDEGMQLPVTERLQTELELLGAMERDELHLVYQPIADLATGQVAGAEALLRWRHPQRGEVPPLHFVPLAEECGLIVPIGRWVLRSACAEAASWSAPLHVAVNVSARQLESPTFVTDVRNALAESGLDATRLVIELTESTVVRDTSGAIEKLHELRALGVRFAVDDFGTGYSSLGQLRRLAVDILKIDRSFIAEIGRSSSAHAMVEALLQMARALDLHTVAEGVEDEAQLAVLQAAECESAQGYFIARPMPPESLRELVAASVPPVRAGLSQA